MTEMQAMSKTESLDFLDPPNPYPHTLLPPLDQPSSPHATSNGSIRAVYENAIEFIDQMGAVDGVFAAFMGTAALLMLGISVRWLMGLPDFWYPALMPLVGFVALIALGRSDSVGYRYKPILFDRLHQKIHVFTDLGSPWWEVWRLFGATPYRVNSYEWRCARGEVMQFRVLGGANLPRVEHLLMFAITEAPGSNKVVDRFGVGFSWAHDDGAMQLAKYEQIRRYMRDEGPPLAPNDALFTDGLNEHWIGSLTFGQPLLGPGSKVWWTGEGLRGAWFLTIPCGIFMLVFLLPVTVPFSLIRWLVRKGKSEPKWPDEILASVGKKLLPDQGR